MHDLILLAAGAEELGVIEREDAHAAGVDGEAVVGKGEVLRADGVDAEPSRDKADEEETKRHNNKRRMNGCVTIATLYRKISG